MNFPQCTYFPLEEKASLLSQHFKVILKLNRSAASNSTGLNPYLIFNCVCISINHKEASLCLNSDSQLSLNCLAQLSYALVGSREYYTTSYGTLVDNVLLLQLIPLSHYEQDSWITASTERDKIHQYQ